jgi:hypothetical protein
MPENKMHEPNFDKELFVIKITAKENSYSLTVEGSDGYLPKNSEVIGALEIMKAHNIMEQGYYNRRRQIELEEQKAVNDKKQNDDHA